MTLTDTELELQKLSKQTIIYLILKFDGKTRHSYYNIISNIFDTKKIKINRYLLIYYGEIFDEESDDDVCVFGNII